MIHTSPDIRSEENSMNVSRRSAEVIPHDCIIKIYSVYDSLKKAEKRFADFLLKDPEYVATHSIAEVAKASGSSDPTIIRFAKRLDYEGFADLKRSLGSSKNVRAFWYHDGVRGGDTFYDTINKVQQSAIQGLNDTFSFIDRDSLNHAIDLIVGANLRIVYGLGDSAIVARFFQYNLAKMGFITYFSEDVDFISTTAFHLSKDDVFFAISHSGMSETTIRMVNNAKMSGAKVICLTNYANSQLAKLSDVVLTTAVFTEHMYSVNSAKRVAQMCVLEVIIANMILRGQDQMKNYLESEDEQL